MQLARIGKFPRIRAFHAGRADLRKQSKRDRIAWMNTRGMDAPLFANSPMCLLSGGGPTFTKLEPAPVAGPNLRGAGYGP
jgi:hypothetical protein